MTGSSVLAADGSASLARIHTALLELEPQPA
jgi:hypothetical protein